MNVTSVVANPPAPSSTPTLPQPAGGHQPSASENFLPKAWNRYQYPFPIFEARIRAWFKSPFFEGVMNFTETLPGTEHQSSLLRLRLMSGLLPDMVLSIFLQKNLYESDVFSIWGRILDKYNPRGKDALFESVSALYKLEQAADETISNYMSRARRLFSSLHVITFNTMSNLFFIVNSDRSRFGSLANIFFASDPEVVNANVDRLETLLEAINSRSRVVDSQPTPRPSALRGSAPRSDPTPF